MEIFGNQTKVQDLMWRQFSLFLLELNLFAGFAPTQAVLMDSPKVTSLFGVVLNHRGVAHWQGLRSCWSPQKNLV